MSQRNEYDDITAAFERWFSEKQESGWFIDRNVHPTFARPITLAAYLCGYMEGFRAGKERQKQDMLEIVMRRLFLEYLLTHHHELVGEKQEP